MGEPVSIEVALVDHHETEVQLLAALESVMDHFSDKTSAAEKERATGWLARRYVVFEI